MFGLVYLGKPASATAQYEGVNYVRRVDILKAYESDCDEDLSNDEQLLHRKTWQFYDDLGRPSVLAESGKNFNGTYAVSMNEYDQTGRISKVWTPFDCGTVIEAENPWALQIKSGQYFNDTYGFTQIGYNTFDEPVAETGSGKAWHENSKMKTVRYMVNKANTVRRYEAPTNAVSLVDAGYYAPGSLTGEITTDEDGIKTETYRDVLGNVIMEKTGNNCATYYVYNTRNELRYVLSPGYQEAGYKDLYAYEYRYEQPYKTAKGIYICRAKPCRHEKWNFLQKRRKRFVYKRNSGIQQNVDSRTQDDKKPLLSMRKRRECLHLEEWKCTGVAGQLE